MIYRIWGLEDDGRRDLLGTCEAHGMGQAITDFAKIYAPMEQTLKNYPRVVIEKVSSYFEGD